MLLVEVVVGLTVLLLRADDGAEQAPAAAPAVTSTVVGSVPERAAELLRLQRTSGELQELLDRRAAAVLARDVDALLADVAPDVDGLRDRQAAWLAGVPEDLVFSRFEYEVQPGQRVAAVPGGTAPRVTLTYALAGFDDDPVRTRRSFEVAERDGRLLLVDDGLDGVWSPDPLGRAQRRVDGEEEPGRVVPDGAGGLGQVEPEPVGPLTSGRVPLWDLGPVTVSRGDGVLAVSHVGAEALRDAWRDDVVDALPRVERAWPLPWSQTVVLLVPADAADAEMLLGDGTDLSQIAAVATALLDPETAPGTPGSAAGERVVVNPAPFTRLSPLAQDVVLTHEVVHVAARETTGTATPLWLAEGFADHVAYDSLDIGLLRGAPTLTAQVRAGELPDAPPATQDFLDPPEQGLALVYETSWSLVDHLADAYGEDVLLRLYADVGRPGGDVERVLQELTGDDLDAVVAEWQESLRAELG